MLANDGLLSPSLSAQDQSGNRSIKGPRVSVPSTLCEASMVSSLYSGVGMELIVCCDGVYQQPVAV